MKTIRGRRLVAAGLIAVCTAVSASVTAATMATAATAGRTSTSAHASTPARATSPAQRPTSLAQLAMLEQRAKASHATPGQQGTLTGSVLGFDSRPVAGACVTAVGAGRSVTTMAAPNGTFRMPGLTAGSYALEYRDCSPAGRDLTSASGYLTTWSGGASTQSSAARLQVAAGQVRHVPVMMLRPSNPAAAIAAKQASFRLELAANSRSSSAARAARAGEITGKVTGKGKALRGICVTVDSVRSGHRYAATTGKNGTYTVRHVVAGRYHVIFAGIFCPAHSNWLEQVYKDDNKPSALVYNRGTVVRVRAGQKVTGIDAKLRLGGEISGTVTSKSGARLRGICVSTYESLDRGVSFLIESQTAANGTYHLHALFPGRYIVGFRIGCGSHGSNYVPAERFGIHIRLGLDRTVNEQLAPGASITGTVTSSSGTPLGGICVAASYVNGNFLGYSTFTATSSNGDYRILGLIGGKYQLSFSPGCKNNGNYASVTLTAQTTAGHQTSGVNAELQTGAIIHGTITGSSGKPLPGICVEIVKANEDPVIGAELYYNDTNGSYSINQFSAGKYQVGFFGGCGNRGSYAEYWYQNQPGEGTASWLNVTTGNSFTVDAPMPPGATITGKVTSGGKGLSGICVAAESQTDSQLGGSYAETGTRHSTYTLANLAPGQYLINFGCGGGRYSGQWFPGAPDPAAADVVSAPAGRTANINAALQPGGTIKGVVTGEAGHPVRRVCAFPLNIKGSHPALAGISVVRQIIDSGDVSGWGVTSRRGTYQISGLAAGRYHVLFIPCIGAVRYAEQWYRGKASPGAATDVTVRAGKTTPGIDGHLVLGGSISGRVVDASGKPLSNICVIAATATAGAVGGRLTGTTGTYTIPGLGSGPYTVEFSPCGNQNLVTVAKQAVVTAPDATKDINATMQPGGSIAGTVTAGSASGADVAGTCVEVYSGKSAEPLDTVFTGPDGSYVVTGLRVGTYEVYFGDPQCNSTPGLAPQWYSGQLTQATAQTVNVTAVGSTTPSIDAALQPDGEITGTVSAKSGPLSGACVTAVPLSAGASSASGSLPVVAVTGTTGYTLADLLPGRYKVKFSAGCGAVGYVTQWWKQQTSQKKATVIRVGPGQDKSGISATLSQSG